MSTLARERACGRGRDAVPPLPEAGPGQPGPFSFASAQRVRGILESAGFGSIVLHPNDLALDLADGHGLDAAVDVAVGIGPAGRALEGQPPAVRTAAVESIRAALAPYRSGQAVPLACSFWIVTAAKS